MDDMIEDSDVLEEKTGPAEEPGVVFDRELEALVS